ncbi:hypothetical protein E2C01_052331 [Portunus trituberculatus]|uniref:Uncharacterized protein n=1 Tax=Portunus trituberculatus TaxID=210409 RepID=A0A5B7GLK6_PORTR|nr:hypothetical protein [Portunus trituberculatus]
MQTTKLSCIEQTEAGGLYSRLRDGPKGRLDWVERPLDGRQVRAGGVLLLCHCRDVLSSSGRTTHGRYQSSARRAFSLSRIMHTLHVERQISLLVSLWFSSGGGFLLQRLPGSLIGRLTCIC